MNLTEAIKNFISDTKHIMEWLRVEGETLSRADLHILEVQLYLLQTEVEKWKDRKPHTSPPGFPPFKADDD